MNIMLRDTMDCCSMEGMPILAIRLAAGISKKVNFKPRLASSFSMRTRRRTSTKKEMNAHRPWAIRVAQATPATPMLNLITKSRSRTMLVSADTIRKRRGVLLSPRAL